MFVLKSRKYRIVTKKLYREFYVFKWLGLPQWCLKELELRRDRLDTV